MSRPAQLSQGPLRVAVGLLTDAAGRYLVNRRRPDTHMAGAWEFPGGKRHEDESGHETLGRELHEELGIAVVRAEFLMLVAHDYDDRQVELEVFAVHEYDGQARGLEGQELRWVALAELDSIGLLAADRPIIEKLRGAPHLNTSSA